jgi:hypothetical protein
LCVPTPSAVRVQRGKWHRREPNKTVPDPVCGSSLDQAARPRGAPYRLYLTATHHHGYIASALPRLLTATAAPAMTWLPLNVVIDDNDRREVTARAHIARARLGLVLRRCPEIPPGHMQGGSRCPGRAVEPERARWHDPVLGRWLGLTPVQPALCLRGFPTLSTGESNSLRNEQAIGAQASGGASWCRRSASTTAGGRQRLTSPRGQWRTSLPDKISYLIYLYQPSVIR